MKSEVRNREIERSGDFKEKEFVIENNHEAFRILSDGLYSDKIKAIIRELSCNAYDAHVEAGYPTKKFDIHLPTAFEPIFYIRDYGTGMSKKDIEGIYTTYFGSTKKNSNKYVGQLGLGSKSPFSYTTIFTVLSYFNGMQYLYSAMENESGTPAVTLINESETDEPNGIKVQFAVKREDFDEFSYKSSEVFHYFETEPNILGNTAKITSPKYTSVNDKWGMSSDRHCTAFALMGNVAYPINLSKVDFSHQEKQILQNFPVDLFFAIGDIQVAASREALSYTDRTTVAIRSRAQLIVDFEQERIEKDLVKQKNYWEAVIWFREQRSDNQVVNMLFGNNPLSYDGRKLKDYTDINKQDYFKLGVADENQKFCIMKYEKKRRWNSVGDKISLRQPHSTFRIQYSDNDKIFLHDCKTRHMMRVRKHFEDNPSCESVYLLEVDNEEDLKKFAKEIGNGAIEKLSSIEPPKTIRAKNGGSARGQFVEYNWKQLGAYDPAKAWKTLDEESEFDLKEGGFYVPVYRWKTNYNGKSHTPQDFLHKLNSIYNVISPNTRPVIYGIKVAKMELIEKNKNWIPWVDHVQVLVRDYSLIKSHFEQISLSISKEQIDFDDIGRAFYTLTHSDRSDFRKVTTSTVLETQWFKDCECDIVKGLAERYDAMESVVAGENVITALRDLIQGERSSLTKKEIKKLVSYAESHDILMEEMHKKYPLIDRCYNTFTNTAGINNLLDYINAMTYYKA